MHKVILEIGRRTFESERVRRLSNPATIWNSLFLPAVVVTALRLLSPLSLFLILMLSIVALELPYALSLST